MNSILCKAILQSGPNKGQGCKYKAKSNGYCGVHKNNKSTKVTISKSEIKSIVISTNLPYFGEEICIAIKGDGKRCENQGYYWYNNQILCGVHSRKYLNRIKLKKNPNEKEMKKQRKIEHNKTVEKANNENIKNGKKGKIIMRKIRMMREPKWVERYLSVFPNNRPTHRKLGLHLGNLSPMQLGPIIHNNVKCLNIENFHQGNKIFENEVDKNKKPLPIYFERKNKLYKSDIAYRHKWKAFKDFQQPKGNKNICLYSILPGDNIKYTYLQSRKFYCKYYQKLAENTDQFKQLKKLIDEGMNICIYGYDARVFDEIITIEQINEWYKDSNHSFGHEVTLYCLLMKYKFNFKNERYETI